MEAFCYSDRYQIELLPPAIVSPDKKFQTRQFWKLSPIFLTSPLRKFPKRSKSRIHSKKMTHKKITEQETN